MQLAIFAFLAAFLLDVESRRSAFLPAHAAAKTLASGVESGRRQSIAQHCAAPGSRLERLVKPFQKVVPRNPADVSTVQKRLARAGYREQSYVNIFYSSKVLVPGALCLVATVTQVYAYSPLFVYALAAGLGFLAPDFWLSNRISASKTQLRLGLPEALDLMVICVEAGLSVDKATMRTAEELRISQPAIADELNLVYLEQRAGRPRAEAWRHVGERTDVDTDSFAGVDTDPGGQVRHECRKDSKGSLGNAAYAAAAGCGGEGGEDHRETRLPTGSVHFSLAVRRDARSFDDRHVRGV